MYLEVEITSIEEMIVLFGFFRSIGYDIDCLMFEGIGKTAEMYMRNHWTYLIIRQGTVGANDKSGGDMYQKITSNQIIHTYIKGIGLCKIDTR